MISHRLGHWRFPAIGLAFLGLVAYTLALGPRARGQMIGEGLPVAAVELSTTVTSIRAVAGTLLTVECNNPNVLVTYVQMFDLATTVTLGTTVATRVVTLAPSTGTGIFAPVPPGLSMPLANGLQVAATTTASGSTAPVYGVHCTFVVR